MFEHINIITDKWVPLVSARVAIKTGHISNKPEKNPRFYGLFFCLHAQIEGFKNGCMPFIGKYLTSLLYCLIFLAFVNCIYPYFVLCTGIDGCFLKLGNGAQVLAATARDGNNNFYPLAFGVVGTEDTATWSWFLNQLKYALGGTAGQFRNATI